MLGRLTASTSIATCFVGRCLPGQKSLRTSYQMRLHSERASHTKSGLGRRCPMYTKSRPLDTSTLSKTPMRCSYSTTDLKVCLFPRVRDRLTSSVDTIEKMLNATITETEEEEKQRLQGLSKAEIIDHLIKVKVSISDFSIARFANMVSNVHRPRLLLAMPRAQRVRSQQLQMSMHIISQSIAMKRRRGLLMLMLSIISCRTSEQATTAIITIPRRQKMAGITIRTTATGVTVSRTTAGITEATLETRWREHQTVGT